MAINHELVIDVGGMKSAVIRDDGSLIIATRKTLSEFTESDWAVVVEISPVGVKSLKALLDRDAQLRIGADEAGHTCPYCKGEKVRLSNVDGKYYDCIDCKGTGQA